RAGGLFAIFFPDLTGRTFSRFPVSPLSVNSLSCRSFSGQFLRFCLLLLSLLSGQPGSFDVLELLLAGCLFLRSSFSFGRLPRPSCFFVALPVDALLLFALLLLLGLALSPLGPPLLLPFRLGRQPGGTLLGG